MQTADPVTPPLIFVSSTASPTVIADRIVSVVGYDSASLRVALQAIGAAAVNQAIKATIIAIPELEAMGLQVSWVPSFSTANCTNGQRTAIRIDLATEPLLKPRASAAPTPNQDSTMLLVGRNTVPGSSAGSVAFTILDRLKSGEPLELYLQAIGAGAVNQAVKVAIIAINFLARSGLVASWRPAFSRVEISGDEKSVVQFHLTARKG